MARITYNQPLDNFDLDRAAQVGINGTVESVTSTHIVFSDGTYKSDLTGIFPSVNTDMGVFTGITYSLNNTPYVTITGLNVKVADAANTTSLFSGNDTYIGSTGNDHFYAWPGDDSYSGGAGIDTVHYAALKSDFTVSSVGTVATVKGLGKSDALFDVERINFQEDGSTLALDVNAGQNAGSAYRLYEAALGRTPDKAGLNYWVNELDSGMSIQQVARGFVDSSEFKTLNPGNDAQSIINNYYLNVLHREADTAGSQYWTNELANGMTGSEMLVSFSESAENIANTSAELNNGVWLV